MYHSPPQMLNLYLIKGERPSLSSRLLYEPRWRYIANQSGSAKEFVSPKIGENIEMLVCFICMGTQGRTLIDIKHDYQITMNQHKKLNIKIEYIYIQSNIFIVSAAFLFKSFYLISFWTKRLQRKKKFLPAGGL